MLEKFSPLYIVLTCPRSSVVRRDELFVLVVLNLNRAGTTFAAESLASKVITQAATIMKPATVFLTTNFNQQFQIFSTSESHNNRSSIRQIIQMEST